MGMKNLFQRAIETARLMVGVGDYQKYCAHMQRHHPDVAAMTETEYFRYGQNARYPSDTNRRINKCPC